MRNYLSRNIRQTWTAELQSQSLPVMFLERRTWWEISHLGTWGAGRSEGKQRPDAWQETDAKRI